jgi:hypothetical protein
VKLNPDIPINWMENIVLNTEEGGIHYADKKMNDLALSSLKMAFTKEGFVRFISRS